MRNKKIISILLSFAIFCNITAPSFTYSHTNNDYSNHWAKNKIDAAKQKGYISGYDDSAFKPNNHITRAEFISIINKAFNYTNQGEINFIDVDKNSWYKKDVAIAFKAGYISGTGKNKFSPNALLTREQACIIIAKIQNLKNKTSKITFSDFNSVSPWARESVVLCINANLISGYTDNSFKPKNTLTRAEAVTLVENMLDMNNKKLETKKDNEIKQYTDKEKNNTLEIENKSEISVKNNNSNSSQNQPNKNDIKIGADTDNDGLTDEIEFMLGSNLNKADTDEDGLNDYFEFSYLLTDLLKKDSDENGITDADEDFDSDGLTNIQEQKLGTRPDEKDSDADDLSDIEEINNYKTNPIKKDTDDDGLTDSEEIHFGLNPNNPKTDGSTPDGERRFNQVAKDELYKEDGILKSDNWLTPSISGNVPGNISKNIFMREAYESSFKGNRSVLSDVIKLETTYEDIPLTLSFSYTKEYTGDFRSLIIAYYTEEKGLLLIDTVSDKNKKTISGEITGSGTYFVMDLDEFLKGLGIDVMSNLKKNGSLNTIKVASSKYISKNFANNSKSQNISENNDTAQTQNNTQNENIMENIDNAQNQTVNQDISQNNDTVQIQNNTQNENITENIDNAQNQTVNQDISQNNDTVQNQTLNEQIPKISPTEELYDYLYDNYGNVIDKKEKLQENLYSITSLDKSLSLTTGTMLRSSIQNKNAIGKADIVFVIDTTGSMSNAISEVKENINYFSEKLVSEYNVDANFSLIEYRDITSDGVDSTKQHKNVNSNWFTNVNIFKSEIDKLSVGGGGDTPETPIDALEMARNLDYRKDATKFVILISDADYKIDNTYGIQSMEDMSKLFLDDNIIVSSISYYEEIYQTLTNTTQGLYGYIYGNFSEILLKLANKLGKLTNEGVSWVFLDDFSSVKLSSTLENIGTNDTDFDGLTDKEELNEFIELDMTYYIKKLLEIYGIIEPIRDFLPESNLTPAQLSSSTITPQQRLSVAKVYRGKSTLPVWKHSSNPTAPDTDYDGINDNIDTYPKDNTFKAKFHWKEKDTMKQTLNDVEFTVDYRLLFDKNEEYKRNLAIMSSIFASDIYDDTYLTFTKGAVSESDNATDLAKLFGMQDVENIKINGEKYNVDVDDSTEFVIGHRKVNYNGVEKEIILLSVRGTNGTNAEWSSNFDVGADTKEYYKAMGKNHPHWLNKQNHKGFDVASNRIIEKAKDYLSRHSLNKGTILITGHSRGAAISNLLGKYFEDDSNFTSYVYTFATPNSTTDNNTASYKSIFNIVNKDDIIPYLPLEKWGFSKYGTTHEISVASNYEYKLGKTYKYSWEWFVGKDYNHDRGTQRTLGAFFDIAKNREDLYKLDTSSDGKVLETNKLHSKIENAQTELDTLSKEFKKEKLDRFSNMYITKKGFFYAVETNYSPAYLMQILANMATETGPNLGRDTKGKYARAKSSFIASSGNLNIMGGMTDPHEKITYYVISHNYLKE